jgi:hypothetical protein
MMEFEGHEGQTALQPSGNQFWARQGVMATPATGNGSLPPGATETPDMSRGKGGGTTTAAFVKKVGG